MTIHVDDLPADLAADIREYCHDNNLPLPTDRDEAFRYWLEWNGIVNFESRILIAFFEIVANSSEYLTTTDAEKATWLKKVCGVHESVEL